MKTKYRIADCQISRYFADGELFDSKKEILDQLASYHDIDYKGVKDDDTPYKDIYEFLNTLKNDEKRLNWILDYGEWDIEEVNACDICGEEEDNDGRCGCTNKNDF